MQNAISEVSRRRFLAQTSYLGAMYAAASIMPLKALSKTLAEDSRIAATPIVDKGFASVRKIGEGLYATISDTSKGLQTMCNGGILVGKDGALLVEGFVSAAGTAFQIETARSITQVPIKVALDTHYHFDHSMGNSAYGMNGIPLWAHAATAKRIYDSYGAIQAMDKATFLGPFEKRAANAKNDVEKAHAESDVRAFGIVYSYVSGGQLALPNHGVDPKTRTKLDLGGLTAVIEHYPGHSGTDVVVRVPEQNVVYTGDLLFNGSYPVAFDDQSNVSAWRSTLKTFASWDKDTIFVPGHGQLCGQEGIALIRSTFDDIEEQAQKLHKAGVPVEEAQHKYVVPERFSKLGIFAWGFTIGPTIRQMYAAWDAKK